MPLIHCWNMPTGHELELEVPANGQREPAVTALPVALRVSGRLWQWLCQPECQCATAGGVTGTGTGHCSGSTSQGI